MTRKGLLPWLLLVAGSAPVGVSPPAAGQEPVTQALPAGRIAQEGLEEAARDFSRLWEAGTVGEIGKIMVPGGIRFHLQDQAHASLPPRQAVAALKDFLNRHRGLELAVARVSEAGGEPPRGFAELVWRAVAAGTSEPIRYVVYIGFVLDQGSWRVFEVRVMR